MGKLKENERIKKKETYHRTRNRLRNRTARAEKQSSKKKKEGKLKKRKKNVKKRKKLTVIAQGTEPQEPKE